MHPKDMLERLISVVENTTAKCLEQRKEDGVWMFCL